MLTAVSDTDSEAPVSEGRRGPQQLGGASVEIQLLADSRQSWALGRAGAAATVHGMGTRP